MGHPADVGLVDAHAEGHGGGDDQPVLALKAGLDRAPGLGLHPAVIGDRGKARLGQGAGQRLGPGAGRAIDDPRLAGAGRGKVEDLAARPVLGAEGEVDVRPVEAAQEHQRLRVAEQPRQDLVAGLGIGGRCEGRKRHPQRVPQGPDAQVVGAEIMAPLADAMGLVHRDRTGPGAPQQRLGRPRGEPFGRDVKQPQLARLEGAQHLGVLVLGIAAGQRGRGHPRVAERADLVAHQRDQRRDDDRQPRPQQRRKLEAQRLAAARGHDRQHLAAGGDGLDDLLLAGAEIVEAEDLPQHPPRGDGLRTRRTSRHCWRARAEG